MRARMSNQTQYRPFIQPNACRPISRLRLTERGNPITTQFFLGEFFGRNELIMALSSYADAIWCAFKFEQGDQIGLNELRRQWPTDCIIELCGADRDVLLNLNDAQAIFPAFRLHGDNVMSAFAIHADIHFVGFNLSKVENVCAQMILK